MGNVCNAVPKIAVDFVAEVAKRENVFGDEALFTFVKQELSKQWPESDQYQIFAGRMRLDSDDNIRAAIYVYQQTLNWSDVLEGGVRMRNISERVVHLIDHLITEAKASETAKQPGAYNFSNADDIFAFFCDYIENIYEEQRNNESDEDAERNPNSIERMGIHTTKDVRYAVDMYLVYKSLGYLRSQKPLVKRSPKKSRKVNFASDVS